MTPELGRTARVETLPFETSQSSVELLESLRRISQAVRSTLDLDSALQGIVDAVCDHTQWQVCWINEVHVGQNAVDVVARRDKLEYTMESRQRRWDLHRSPSVEALRLNAAIAIPDVSNATEFPDYREDALSRGAVAAVVLPFSTSDPTDLPRTLSVQSPLPLLEDERHLPFLRTVTGMASLAVHNARQATASSREMLQRSEALSLFTFVTEHLAKGMSTAWLCHQLEQRTDATLLAFDGAGNLNYVGRSPVEYEVSDEEWAARVRGVAGRLAKCVVAHNAGALLTADVSLGDCLPIPPTHHAVVSRLAGSPPLGALITISRAGAGLPMHQSLGPVVASILLRDHIRLDVERDLNADMLSRLFSAETDDGSVARRAEACGIDIGLPQTLVLLGGVDPKLAATQRLALSAVAGRWPGTTIHSLESYLVAFIPGDDPEPKVRELRTQLAVEVYVAWSGPCSSRADYPSAWNECITALELAQKLDRHDPVNLKQFGSYRFLLAALGERDIGEYIDHMLGALVRHDRNHGSDLLETLETFLNCSGRHQAAARQLHIHVSTLRYRLDRIRTLIDVDLTDEDARFEVSLALRLFRLRPPPVEG